MRLLTGVLALFLSINSFAKGELNEVRFANGAKLVVKHNSGFQNELLYYPPGSNVSTVYSSTPQQRITITRGGNSYLKLGPQQVIDAHFKRVAPKFWPVLISNDFEDHYRLRRFYISEEGETLEVARGKSEVNVTLAFDIPDKWEVHKVIFEQDEYLVIVEERIGRSTQFHYLRLSDGLMATHIDHSTNLGRGFFDETSGLLNEVKSDGSLVTYSPTQLKFEPTDRTGKPNETWWFPVLEQARSLKVVSVGPFKNPPDMQKEEQKPEEGKEISEAERGEKDLNEIRYKKFEFEESAAEFALTLKPQPDFQIVGRFQAGRFVLGQTGKMTLIVLDSWTNEITDTMTLEDEHFLIENTPRSFTTTILYPRLHVEVIYKQPDNNNSRLRQISRKEESIPEFCRDLVMKELEVVK